MSSDQLDALNRQLAALAVTIGAKEKALLDKEKLYDDKLAEVNRMIARLQGLLDVEAGQGRIPDSEVYEKQRQVGDHMVVVPTVPMYDEVTNATSPTGLETKQSTTGNYPDTHLRRPNGTCSFCGKRGHKRASCPKKLLGST